MNLSKRLSEELFWMDRNKQGLYEEGYLLTKEQLLKETDFTEKDLLLFGKENLLDGAYSGDDTYTVEKLSSLSEVKTKLTWADFKYTESYAASELCQEYPDYVDEKYRIGMVVYNATGTTAEYLPNSCDKNDTVFRYCSVLGLDPEKDIEYHYSEEELAIIAISYFLYNNELTEELYNEILDAYHLLEDNIAQLLQFTSPRGKTITFDTFEDETKEYGTYWVDMCPTCHNKYRNILKNRFDDGGSGKASCSVKGCSNTNASYYVDFNKDEVKIIGEKSEAEKMVS